MFLASTFTISGAHGFLILIAMLLFIIAAVIAWFVQPRYHYATALAAGLAFYMLALLFTGS